MPSSIHSYIAVFLTGLVVSYLLTPGVRSLAQRYGVIDLPDERRPHRYPTARGGGIAVVVAVHAACLLAVALAWTELESGRGFDFAWWARFAGASLVLVVVGIVDDVRGMKPWHKLGGQTLAALLMWWGGLRFGALLGISLPPVLDGLLVVLWIVGIINAFNLIDGMDGLASGLACISSAGLCGILLIIGAPAKVLVLLGLIGACLGFLRYNFHPASIFLGDTGSMFIGFTLAVVSLETLTKSSFFLSLAIPILILGLPIHDELLAVWRRGMRRLLETGRAETGKPTGVMSADLEHIHHRLLRAGFSTRRVAYMMYLGNAILVAVGLLLMLYQSYAVGILLLIFVTGTFVLIRNLAVIELRDTGSFLLRGLARPTPAKIRALLDPLWDTIWLAAGVTLAMRFEGLPRTASWNEWFLELPIWVTPTVSLLAWSRTYVTIWARARVLDALMLVEMLLIGLGISLAIALLIDPSDVRGALLRTMMVGSISMPAIFGLRMLFRVVQELTVHFKNKSDSRSTLDRAVLYGAGQRCQLLLKDCAFRSAGGCSHYHIVGLIDDDPLLQGQWVYGYPILGGASDLEHLAEYHRLTRIVVTATLDPQRLRSLQELAHQRGIRLSEWRCGERDLPANPTPTPS